MAISFRKLAIEATMELADEAKAERGQAIVRFWYIFLVTVYVLLRGAGIGPTDLPADVVRIMLTYYVGFTIFSLVIFWTILRWPGHYPARRAITMLGDYVSLTHGMIVGGFAMMPLFALVLWVTVGNGMRYGPKYLLAAWVMAQLSIMVTTIFNPFWRDNPDMVMTMVFTAAAVPTYAFALLRQTAEARTDAQNANLAKSRFLAQASHDLRQPVHAIGLFLAGLRDTRLNGTQSQIVERIERALQGVARLFKSLLDISTLDSGTLKYAPNSVDLNMILSDVMEQNEEAAKWNNVDLRFVATSATVIADPVLLTTMLQNLVSNAIKYGEGGSVLVGVRRSGNKVTLEVHDQGIGISDEHQPFVFEEFYRVQQPGDRDRDGVGLGLAIVARLAQLCGLEIKLHSTLGKGTVASICGFRTASSAGEGTDNPLSMNRTPLAGFRIVLIEDDRDVLAATAALLKGWGCLVQDFDTMPDTVELADLILTDFDLGSGITGTRCIAHIRSITGTETPAIIMTRHDEARVRSLIELPRVQLMTKPLRPSALRSLLSSVRIGAF